MNWAYGITTVPERISNLLSDTIGSLERGGFDSPRIFIDGSKSLCYRVRSYELETTARYPSIGAFAHWVLSLFELYARNPKADRYVLFQDDIQVCRNLRSYLESYEYTPKTYWNLYTFKENQDLANGRTGFYESNQQGYGALALVFDQQTAAVLLSAPELTMHLRHPTRSHKCIDGVVMNSLTGDGWKEMVHNPSLVQHTGNGRSTLKNPTHPLAQSFPGEEFDAMSLTR